MVYAEMILLIFCRKLKLCQLVSVIVTCANKLDPDVDLSEVRCLLFILFQQVITKTCWSQILYWIWLNNGLLNG